MRRKTCARTMVLAMASGRLLSLPTPKRKARQVYVYIMYLYCVS